MSPIARWTAMGLIAVTATVANAQVLYDGPAGGPPESQPWLTYQAIPGSTFYASSGGSTELDTTANNLVMAGWHNHNSLLTELKNPAFPTLDRAIGFTVTIDLRVILESHGENTDRAGFSLLALASDAKGIEISFWTNEVWAQSGPNLLTPAEALFTHAEGVAHNTATTNQQRYDLTILGDTYSLAADGLPILTGPVRDYSSWTPPPGAPNIYALPNLLSFSDNTTSAAAAVEFSYIAIPEPSFIALLGCAGLLLIRGVDRSQYRQQRGACWASPVHHR